MYQIEKRTWLAGADPTGDPDQVKTLVGAATRAAAEAKARSLAEGTGSPRQDPHTGSWWGKAPNALHEFRVVEAPK